jgi:hypothetical protein
VATLFQIVTAQEFADTISVANEDVLAGWVALRCRMSYAVRPRGGAWVM